jgi:hypothetical protein
MPIRNQALRIHRNNRIPGSWGRAAITTFLYLLLYGTSIWIVGLSGLSFPARSTADTR